MVAIQTIGLTKNFGDVRAVDGLSFVVNPGEIFGLVGPDGSGKTTMMRLLTAILEPTSGDAWVMGKHVVHDAEAIKEETGYVSQRFGLYPDLTVLENIRFYGDIYGIPRKGRDEKIERLLSFSNLTPFKKRYAKNLSGGMKQKLGLACALIHTPRVLFLDEPTNGVDPVSRRDFWRILHQLQKENVTIFVSTAYLDEADRCHRVGLLHRGKLLAVDTPKSLRKLMRGSILELRPSEARRGVVVLRRQLRAESVAIFGDRIHVATQSPDETVAAVRSAFQQEGIDLLETRIIEPTLEDIFVSVLSDKAPEDSHAAQ